MTVGTHDRIVTPQTGPDRFTDEAAAGDSGGITGIPAVLRLASLAAHPRNPRGDLGDLTEITGRSPRMASSSRWSS